MTRHHEFETLLETHKRLLYKVCWTFARTDADRDDLAQEIATQLWRSFGSYDPRASFATWMYRIALNVAISACRRARTRARYVIDDDARLLEVADDRASVAPELSSLLAQISELAPLDRALVLLYLEGHPHRAIAEMLGTTEHNVATRFHRIKQGLRARRSA